jgi:hypothetical protein
VATAASSHRPSKLDTLAATSSAGRIALDLLFLATSLISNLDMMIATTTNERVAPENSKWHASRRQFACLSAALDIGVFAQALV